MPAELVQGGGPGPSKAVSGTAPVTASAEGSHPVPAFTEPVRNDSVAFQLVQWNVRTTASASGSSTVTALTEGRNSVPIPAHPSHVTIQAQPAGNVPASAKGCNPVPALTEGSSSPVPVPDQIAGGVPA